MNRIGRVMSFYVSEIKHGAPSEFPNEISELIYARLTADNVPFTRVKSDPGITMDDCLNLDRAFGVDTVKTILLTNRQKNKFWLYVTYARAPFVTKDFCAALGIPRVSFADEELMVSLLGCRHGAATPLALLKDGEHKIEFVMDRDVASRESIVITEGDACGFICIRNKDLFALTGREPIIIDRVEHDSDN